MAFEKLRGEVLVDFKDEIDNSINGFEVTWSNLYYRVYPSKFSQVVNTLKGQRRISVTKTILKNCSGTIRSGQFSAIMGPSGSGKSTLLKCLAGLQVSGLEGNIKFSGSTSPISLIYLPQDDKLIENLTVRESVSYSYRMKNDIRRLTISDEKKVTTLLNQLGLNDCADRLIKTISGGQKKRTSIAQELTNSPNILLLDEPTSGLDSSSCFQLIELLNSIMKQSPIAVMISIHQPSSHSFSALHDVTMLSHDGRTIFSGKPEKTVETLLSVGIQIEKFTNPADVLTEVAFGSYGLDTIDKLVGQNEKRSSKDQQLEIIESVTSKRKMKINDKPFHDCIDTSCGSSLNIFLALTARHYTFNKRDKLTIILRYLFGFNIIFLLSTFFPGRGLSDGCLPDTVGNDLKNGRIDSIQKSVQGHFFMTQENICCLFFAMLFVILANLLPLSARIPFFLQIFTKEYSNGWYNLKIYFTSHFAAEVPFSLFLSLICITGQFYSTSQPFDRLFDTIIVFLATFLVAQLHGLAVGILLMDHILSSVLTAPNTLIPMLLLSGFFVHISNMPYIYQIVSHLSYVRYSFEGIVAAVFGFKRCSGQSQAIQVVEESKKQLGSFMHSMFKIARANIDKLVSSQESRLLANQSDALTDSIIASLDGPFSIRGSESVS
ncbi:ATP-binding cassette sub-family G member 1-like [Panonychus citri]|uniref:ATP-binding cassette sub-family G member 1-like n=1 Tax=Panonychus citri TaxID=50023 RepID=UPI0023081D98|nr:ATP-binding cassette sub-family G member 1-like [Panonychus citri]